MAWAKRRLPKTIQAISRSRKMLSSDRNGLLGLYGESRDDMYSGARPYVAS